MKPIFFFIVNIIILYSCQCKHCTDNLTAENEKIPYTYNEIVMFENDTLGIVHDTVYVYLGQVSSKPYACTGSNDDDRDLCSASSSIKYSNFFYIEIRQHPNEGNNKIGHWNPYYVYNDTNSISIEYNNTIVEAYRCIFETDTLGSKIWSVNISKDSNFVYNEFIYIDKPKYKLIQYTTVYKDGTRRIWRLKE